VYQRQILIGLFLSIGLLFGVFGCRPDPNSLEGLLQGVDTQKALAIANEWKWTHKDIRSYVNTRMVAFELPGDKTKKVPLPDDSMVVAVAPYIKYTHQ
jgi:hypothetical protein